MDELTAGGAPASALGRSVDRLLAMSRRVYRAVREAGPHGVARHLEHRRFQSASARSYRAWVARHDTLTDDDRRRIRERIAALARQPLLSIVMPVYDVDEVWLRRAIDSVRAQLYPRWELCIADDCSSRPHVRAVLEEQAALDPRIRVVFRPENGHISAASNSALALASGEFVGFLDHDDELAEHALYLVAEELNAHHDAELLYSDEDKIDAGGRRHHPHFKPDWSPDLLRSTNYLCHFVVCRAEAVRRVGAFRGGYEGAQDYDLMLRLAETIPDQRIRHIPHVLYHWRAIGGSTAHAGGAKSYAHEAGRSALESHLQRCGVAATVADAGECCYRVVYRVPSEPLVSVVVNGADPAGFDVLSGLGPEVLEVLLVVPEESGAPSPGPSSDPRLRLLVAPAGLGPTARLNHAARLATGRVIAFLDGAEPRAGWIREMAGHALRPEIGVVGAKILGADGRIEDAGRVLGLCGVAGRAYRGAPEEIHRLGRMIERTAAVRNYSAVSGACMMVRREVFDELGGFDDRHLPSAWHDVDFCLRAGERGYRVLWTPFAELRCRIPGTVPEVAPREEQAYLRVRWAGQLGYDPYFNPNLSLDREDFGLASPPRAPRPWWTAPAPYAVTSG